MLDHLPFALKTSHMWSLGRGFPYLEESEPITIDNRKNKVLLTDADGHVIRQVQAIKDPSSSFQIEMLNPKMNMTFSQIQHGEIFSYARTIIFKANDSHVTLDFNIKKVVFNPSLDASVFELDIPSNFEHIHE